MSQMLCMNEKRLLFCNPVQDDSFSSGSGSYGDVVAVSQALRENMVAEGKCTNACFLNILSVLSPLQMVRLFPTL